MNTENLNPTMATALQPFFEKPAVYVQHPVKSKLMELVNNPPASVLMYDYKAVQWLDRVREEVLKLK